MRVETKTAVATINVKMEMETSYFHNEYYFDNNKTPFISCSCPFCYDGYMCLNPEIEVYDNKLEEAQKICLVKYFKEEE